MPLRAVIVYDRRGEVTQAAVSGASAPASLRGCLRQALEHLQLDTARPAAPPSPSSSPPPGADHQRRHQGLGFGRPPSPQRQRSPAGTPART
jgi:hypothetical protein